MLRKLLLFEIIFLLCCQLVEAELLTSDCCHPRFAIKAEYIYFQPIFDNTFIPSPNVNGPFPFNLSSTGFPKKNKFDYTSGCRLSAFYFNPNADAFIEEAGLRFTYLPAEHSRRIKGKSLLESFSSSSSSEVPFFNQTNVFKSLLAKHRLNYYAGDLFITHSIIQDDRFSLVVQPGLHYAGMHYQNHVRFSAGKNMLLRKGSLKETCQTWGIGPQLGFIGHYRLNTQFELKGILNGGLLASRSTAHFQEKSSGPTVSPSTIKASNDPVWRVLPFWEICAGLNFSWSIDCYAVEIEVGYDYLTYPDFIKRIQFDEPDIPSIANDIYSNVSFQGPYMSLTIGF